MSCTVDAGVLLYATDEASPFHLGARQLLTDLTAGPEPLYLFWPVVFGYVRLATSAGVFEHPLSEEQANGNIRGLLGQANVRAAGGEDPVWEHFPRAAGQVWLKGDFVSRGYLVGLMRDHRVTTIWTHDPGYAGFPGITARDPFPGKAPPTPRRSRAWS